MVIVNNNNNNNTCCWRKNQGWQDSARWMMLLILSPCRVNLLSTAWGPGGAVWAGLASEIMRYLADELFLFSFFPFFLISFFLPLPIYISGISSGLNSTLTQLTIRTTQKLHHSDISLPNNILNILFSTMAEQRRRWTTAEDALLWDLYQVQERGMLQPQIYTTIYIWYTNGRQLQQANAKKSTGTKSRATSPAAATRTVARDTSTGSLVVCARCVLYTQSNIMLDKAK